MRAPLIEECEEPWLLFVQQVADTVIILWEPFDFSARIVRRDAIFDRK